MRSAIWSVVSLASVASLAGCPRPQKTYPAPAQLPTAEQVVAELGKIRAERRSFTAESTMDYWVGHDRVKGTVLVMGTSQRQVRFNALSPQGGGVLLDMACNGTDFAFVDFQHNCQLSGPCTKDSIASLLRVELEPEDFTALAVGVVPVDPNATGTVTWDAHKGREDVKLDTPAGTMLIAIDPREGRNDVMAAQLIGKDGQVVWSVANSDFEMVKDTEGRMHRLPGKTRFLSPRQKADLLVDWKERTLNPTIDPAKFNVAIPPQLPRCGAK